MGVVGLVKLVRDGEATVGEVVEGQHIGILATGVSL